MSRRGLTGWIGGCFRGGRLTGLAAKNPARRAGRTGSVGLSLCSGLRNAAVRVI